MADYRIKLGIGLNDNDFKGLKTKIKGLEDPVKINLNTKDAETEIEKLQKGLQNLGKGNSDNIFNLNTKSLMDSLDKVKDAVVDIKNVFGSLGNGDTKNLITSVNQIANALEKATKESDGLVGSLNALSKKDFNFSINLSGGSKNNPVKNNQAYSDFAKRTVFPQLEKQIKEYEVEVSKYIKKTNASTDVLLNLVRSAEFEGNAAGEKLQAGTSQFYMSSLGDIATASTSVKGKLEAYLGMFAEIHKAADIFGIKLDKIDAKFAQTPEDLIQKAFDIKDGLQQATDETEKLKNVFGSINAEELSGVLEPITKDLADIKKAFESLSSVGTIDGLTTSFKDLAEVLEKLTSNITIVKQNLDNIGNVGTSTGNVGVENLEQDLKQAETAAKKTSDSIKETVSESKKLNIDISDGGIDELETSLRRLTDNDDIIRRVTNEISQMGVVAKKVSGTLQGKDLVKFDVQGIQKTEDGLERVITLTKTLTKAQDGSFRWLDSSKQTQAINNDFEELKRRAKEISNLKIDIFNLDDVSKISRATAELDNLTNEYDELFAKTKSGLKNSQLSQLDNIIGSGDTKVIREFNSELNEFVKLQKQIENTRFEIGKLEVVGRKQNEIETLKKELEGLEDTYNRLMGTFMKKAVANSDILYTDDFKGLKNGIAKATQDAENRLERFKSQYADTRAELARKIKIDIKLGNFDDDVSRMQNKFDGLSRASDDLRASVETVNDALTELKNASKPNDDGILDTERLIKAQEDYARAIEKTNNLIDIQARKDAADAKSQKLVDDRQVFQSKIDVWLKKNSAATEKFGEAMLKLKRQAENCDRVTLNHLESQFKKLDNAADKAGVKMMSLGDQIKSKFKEYSAYFSVAEVFMWVEQGLRSMFEQVKLIDSAMTELKKVTNETDESYNRFLTNAASRAREIGTTIDGLVSSTADFARLGYDFADAQGLAEVANIYAVVGDDIESVETATESLISTLTAFKKEANGLSSSDFAISVVDKMNEVADTYSISSGGLGEALKRSASSMETANNSLDETIALITAANEVVQDPEVVGQAFKTISMRIRGAKTELESAGESTEGMAKSTASLRQEIMALSGVDIMLNENTFKSTYQILDELSQKWESLSDIAQASIIELMAGKHRGNVMSSLMANFDVARSALETSMNSAGSAMREHERWSQSLEAKLNSLTAAWQGLSQAFLSSNFLKAALDGVIALVDGITSLIDTIGVFPTLLGAFAGFKILTNISGFIKAFKLLGKMSAINGGTIKLAHVIGALSKSFPKATKGVQTFTGALKKMLTTALAHPVLLAIAAGVAVVTGAFVYQKKKAEDLAEEVEELTSKYKEQHEEVKKLKNDFDTSNESSMISKYEKLSKGVDSLGRNVSLTAEEYSEYQSIVNKIAEQFPSLITGYDEQGNALLSCKGNVEALTEAYEKLIHAQNSDILSSSGKIEKDFANSIKDANNEDWWGKTRQWFTNNDTSFWGFLAKTNPIGSTISVVDQAQDWFGDGNAMTTDTAKLLKDLLNTDRSKVDDVIATYDKQTLQEIETALESAGIDTGFMGRNTAKALEETLKNDSAKIKGIVDNFYGNLEETIDQQKTIATAKLSEAFDISSAISGLNYGNISEELQAIAYQTVNSFDYDFLSKLSESGKSVEQWTTEMLNQLNALSKADNAKIEAAFDLQTQFNGGDISYGEYVKSLTDVESVIDGLNLKSEAKEQLKIVLGLDENGVVDEYNDLINRLTDPKNYDFNISETEAKKLLDGLSSEELKVAVGVITDLSNNNYSETAEEIIAAIERELSIKGLSLDLDIEVEKTKLEAVATAITESFSGSGLSEESIGAIKGIFGGLKSYDPSKLFERTANGIRLNTEEYRRLNSEYKKINTANINKEMSTLGDIYNQTREELYRLTYGTEEYNDKARDLNDIEQQIKDLEQLAAGYEGLASAFQEWQMVESAGSQRDMYESIIEGFKNIDDEISRGWYDDGTIEFLELLSGKDLSTAGIEEVKKAYKGLNKEIENTSYSVRDFFTVDDEGNSTNTGVYNFLDAIGQLEEEAFGGKDVVQRKDGKIVGFDFQIVGGDKVIAEALGISEELVQIMVRAADDAGFVVSMDGTYQQLDVLKEKAQEAAESLNKTLEKSGKKGFDFNFNASNVDDVKKQLTEAQKILDTFRNTDGTINTELKGADEALTVASTLQSMLDKLTRPTYMDIEVNQVEDELQEPLRNLQELRRLTETEHQLKLSGGDTTQLTADIEELYTELDGLPDETKIEIGLVDDKKQPLTGDALKKKINDIVSGDAELGITATVDIQLEMDEKLGILVDKALLDAGIIDNKEFKKRVDIYLEADVDNEDAKNKTEQAVNEVAGNGGDGNSTKDGKTSSEKIEVPVDAEVKVDEVKTEGFWDKVKSWWNGLWSDDKTETAEVKTDVEVDAGEIDTSGVQEEVGKTIEELELTIDEYKDLIQNIEDKDVTLSVKVEGLDDVRELNKNIDLATNIEGDIDNLSEFVKGAKALSELDDNISTFVTAEVKGNVVDEFEYKLNNLKVFSDSAKDLDDIGFINSEVTANVKGNVIDEFEYKINNLKVFSDSAKDIGKIGNVESNVKATINSGEDGDVIDEFEYKLNNLGEFAEHVKKLQSLSDVDISVKATINSGENGDVIDEFEYKLDNLSEFANHVRDLQGLQSVDISVNASVNTGETGDVVDTFEYKLNNLSKFADYVKELQGLDNVDVSVNATVNTGNDGDAIDTFEYKLNNLETFAQGAKALQGVGNVSSEVTAKVNTGESGDAIDTFEYKLNNLNTFAEGAKALKGVGNISSTVTAEINSGSDGDVIDEFEYKLNNLEKFAQYARDLSGIGNVNVSVSAKVNTGESGDVIDTFEYKLDNLDEFADYAKELQGLENVDISIKANVNTGESGDVIDTFEYKLNNLEGFADYAKDLQGLESIDITISANVKGNVVGEKTEGKINNLEVFAKGAKELQKLEDVDISVNATVSGDVTETAEYKLDNLGVFKKHAKELQGLEDVDVSVNAEISGNVPEKTEGYIDDLQVFAKGAKALQGLKDVDISVNADIGGNVPDKTEGYLDDLQVFAKGARALQGLNDVDISVNADVSGNALTGDGVTGRLKRLTEFKSLVNNMSDKTVSIKVTASVDSDKINSAIDILKKVSDSGVFKNYNATVKVGATIDKVDDTKVKNYKAPKKDGKVSYSVDEKSSVYTWTAPPKDGVVNYSAKVDALTDSQKHKTGTITYKAKIEGGSPAAGTAHANGTTSGHAFARGNWGIKGNGVALGGELGTEVVVRDGKWFTIGDQGAEFFRYKKNDIVFNATQTAALFKYGGIKGANPRGKMLASGTAFAEGLAFAGSSGSGGAGKVGGKAVDGNSSGKDTENKFEETIDWIETILDRAERAIDKYEKQADNVYKTWDKRNKALTKEINEVGNTISLYEQAKNKYLSEANSVGLSESYKTKVRNGSLNVEDFSGESDEKLVEKIKNYQDLYEKYLDCIDKIDELKEKEASLYSQRFDNVQSEYDNLLHGFDHTQSMLEEYINQAEEKGYIVSKKYYEALIDNEENRIDTLKKERVELIKARDEAVANNEFDKYSENWYKMCEEIDSVTQSIESAETATIEWGNAIDDIDLEIFDLIQKRISDVTDEADFFIELMSNKKLFDDDGKLTSQGFATMGLHAQNYNTYMYQADLAREEAERLKKKWKSDLSNTEAEEDYREMIATQREFILAAEDSKKAIVDLVQEGIELELEALDEQIEKYKDSLDSAKDLYDYQKKVEKQTSEIASLQKQLSAYQGFTDEETKAKVQQLKIELEEAEDELYETELDRYFSQQSALLDSLYDQYTLVLNERLDNTNYLVSQVIDTINAVGGTEGVIDTALGTNGAIAVALGEGVNGINTTLNKEANAVGTTVSNALKEIWSTGDDNAKSILKMYGNEVAGDSETSLQSVLKNIKTNVEAMVDDVDKDAQKNIDDSKTNSSSEQPPTPPSAPSNNGGSAGGDSGKPAITNDVLMGIAAAIWTQGKKAGWENNPNRKNKLVEKLGAANAKKVQQYINEYGASGGLYKHWYGNNLKLADYSYSAFKLGAKKIDESQLAWTQERGQEYIVRPSDGAILTPVAKGDSVLNAQASNNIWNMANSPAEFIKDNLNLGSTGVPNNSTVQNSVTQNFDQIVFSMPNVQNYEQLITQMQRDPNFERLIDAMSIGRLAGKSSLAKGKAIR